MGSRSKQAHLWGIPDALSVTATGCMNAMQSQLILAATSDRCRSVVDETYGHS